MSWIADESVRLWGQQAAWVRDTAHQPHEAYLLKLDASKAHADLHWYPALPPNFALDWIVTWYRAFEEGKDLGKLCRTQMEQYETLTEPIPQRRQALGAECSYDRATGSNS